MNCVSCHPLTASPSYGSLFCYLYSLGDAAPSSRRALFQKGAAALTAGVTAVAGAQAAKAYSVPDLPYDFEALEPYIDTPTMKIHHDKHHGMLV